jgi:predicted DNA-binding protein YlxM (UPF0122 family)
MVSCNIILCKGNSLNKEDGYVLEKTLRMNYLLDFYQALLTPKQHNYMMLYYLDDHSLGEIAEQFEVSRQAVYDNIKRTEIMLEEYEEKLSLLHKFEKRSQLLNELNELVSNQHATPDEIKSIFESLEKLE